MAPFALFAQKAGMTKSQFMSESEKEFKKIDRDKDGFVKSNFGPIDKDEFMKRSEYAFNTIDTDKNGVISIEEKEKAKQRKSEDFGKSFDNWLDKTFK